MPEDQKQAFIRERSSAIVGRRLLDVFGWKLGQNVTIQGTIFPGDWTFTIRGVYTPTDPVINDDVLIFHHDYLEERIGRPGDRRAGTCGDQRSEQRRRYGEDDRRPVPELQRADQDRHRAGVQRQLRHHVGQREPADGHDRHGGGVRDSAGDGQRDDDERRGSAPRKWRCSRPSASATGGCSAW